MDDSDESLGAKGTRTARPFSPTRSPPHRSLSYIVYRSCLHYCLAAACDLGGIHLSGRLDRWPFYYSPWIWLGWQCRQCYRGPRHDVDILSHIFTLLANLLESFNWVSASFEYRSWVKTDCLDTRGMAGGKKSGYLCIFRTILFS